MRIALIFLCIWSVVWGQTCTPPFPFGYCAIVTQHHGQNGTADSTDFPVGVIGIADGTGTGGTSSTNSFWGSNVDLRTAAHGGKIQNLVPVGGLLSGVFKSSGSATLTCSAGQKITLSGFNGGNSGATAEVLCTGPNTIATDTSLKFLLAGTGTTSDPTTASCGNGPIATCSGTVNVDVLFATFDTPADFGVFDSSCSTLLPFEIASYLASTGAIEWYQDETIFHATDATNCIGFGSSSITASPNDIVKTWVNFAFVTHFSSLAFSGSNVIQTLDSTINDNYPTNSGSDFTQVAGVAGDAIQAHGVNSRLNVPTTNNFPVGSSARTYEFCLNMSGSNFPNGVADIGGYGINNSTDKWFGWYGSKNTYGSRNTLVGKLFADDALPSTDFPQDSLWHCAGMTYPSAQTQVQQIKMFLDGSQLSLSFTHPTNTLNTGNNAQGSFVIGGDGSSQIGTGKYDEYRVSTVERSPSWELQFYNNLLTPGLFATVGNFTAAQRGSTYLYVR